MLEVAPQRLPAPLSRRALLLRAAALRGHSVAELAVALQMRLPHTSLRGKGFVGQLVERALGADPQACQRPDFPHLGIELKTIPVNPRGLPIASTFVCSIAMAQADRALWEHSVLRQRLGCVLFIPVITERGTQPAERRLGQAHLWTPSPAAAAILRQDWEDLMGAIGAGRGGSLTAREGRWLQVRPKAAHAGVRTLAPCDDGVAPMLPLGFYLRACATRRIFAGAA